MFSVQCCVSEDCKSAERDAMSTGKGSSNFRIIVLSSLSPVTSPGDVHCVTVTMEAVRHPQTSITLSKYLPVRRCQTSEAWIFSNIAERNSNLVMPGSPQYRHLYKIMTSEVRINIAVFWNVTPCNLVGSCQRSQGTWCLHFSEGRQGQWGPR